MSRILKLSVVLHGVPKQIYNAWLNSKEHSMFTGSEATINNRIGGKFSAWDGYISGETLELIPYEKIVQSWRTTEFPSDSPDSILEVLFKLQEDKEGMEETKLILIHRNIPKGQEEEYEKGWIDFYFEPMKLYFMKDNV